MNVFKKSFETSYFAEKFAHAGVEANLCISNALNTFKSRMSYQFICFFQNRQSQLRRNQAKKGGLSWGWGRGFAGNCHDTAGVSRYLYGLSCFWGGTSFFGVFLKKQLGRSSFIFSGPKIQDKKNQLSLGGSSLSSFSGKKKLRRGKIKLDFGISFFFRPRGKVT